MSADCTAPSMAVIALSTGRATSAPSLVRARPSLSILYMMLLSVGSLGAIPQTYLRSRIVGSFLWVASYIPYGSNVFDLCLRAMGSACPARHFGAAPSGEIAAPIFPILSGLRRAGSALRYFTRHNGAAACPLGKLPHSSLVGPAGACAPQPF
jgi:hypothetical protein